MTTYTVRQKAPDEIRGPRYSPWPASKVRTRPPQTRTCLAPGSDSHKNSSSCPACSQRHEWSAPCECGRCNAIHEGSKGRQTKQSTYQLQTVIQSTSSAEQTTITHLSSDQFVNERINMKMYVAQLRVPANHSWQVPRACLASNVGSPGRPHRLPVVSTGRISRRCWDTR